MTSSINEKIKQQIKDKKLQEKQQVSNTEVASVEVKPVTKTKAKKNYC